MGLLYCNSISSVVYLCVWGGGYDPCNVSLAPVHECVYYMYVWAETDIVLYKVKFVFFAFAFEYLNVNGIRLNAYKEMKQFHLNIFS